ncbi:MAG: arylformamidase [Alphaproteobacteria bacterium]
MTDRPIWDISPPIRTGIPVWPGDTSYSEARTWAIGPDCPVNVSKFTMSTHTGSHADAPSHYAADGRSIGGVDLARYIGRCRVVDGRKFGNLINSSQLEPFLDAPLERLLIRTYNNAPVAAWDSAFAAISAQAIDFIASRGVFLIGVDTPSLDPQESKTMDAHQAVRRHGMSILEGLVLDAIEPGDYELIALPLKLVELDAAPVRAILRPLAE